MLRALVAAVPAAAALVLWRPGYEVFLTPKATVVVLGALALLAVGLVGWARDGRVAVPARPVAVALSLYVVALLLATAAADRPLVAVAGQAGRHVGLAVSLAAVVLFLAAAAAYRDRSPVGAVAVLLAASVPVIGYALAQLAGADPWQWRLVEGGPPVFSTLGNANFLSAWLGIVVPLAAGAALVAPRRAWRWCCGGLALVALATASATGSLQGVVAGLVGLAVVLVGWVATAPRRRTVAWTAAALAAAALAALWAAPDDLGGRAARSLAVRLEHWETAWRMAAQRPWRGVGLGRFGAWSRAYESPEAAAERGLDGILDSPHAVPLELLATGGWPLLLAWAAVVVAVAWVVVRGWRAAARPRRLWIAALGGAWTAYLVQGLVSIDVAPLAALGWTVGGLAVATAGGVGERTLPTTVARPAAVVLLLALLPAGVAALSPWRADLAAARAVGAEAAGDDEAAAAGFARARALASWERRYAALEGAARNRSGDRRGALAAYEEAHRRDPRAVAPLLNIARLALALEDPERAAAAYREALRVAPHTPEVRDEAGANGVRSGG